MRWQRHSTGKVTARLAILTLAAGLSVAATSCTIERVVLYETVNNPPPAPQPTPQPIDMDALDAWPFSWQLTFGFPAQE